MFSLKFDLLFPSLDAAKETAKRLNAAITGPHLPADPRELKRLRDEAGRARDKVRLQTVVHRQLFL